MFMQNFLPLRVKLLMSLDTTLVELGDVNLWESNPSANLCLSYRLNKYWLKGEKAGTMETFANLPGFPDNVRANKKGQFWVAIYCRQSRSAWLLLKYPWLRRALLQLPLSFKQLNKIFLGTSPHAMVILFDEQGQVLEVLEDATGKTVKFVSEVEERDGKLWMGSVIMPHLAIFSR